MKSIRNRTFILAVLAVLCLYSCSDGSDDIDRNLVTAEEILEDAIYLPVADEDQPAWLQLQIAEVPYLKVFRSEKGNVSFLLYTPQKGGEVNVFDKEGKELFVSSNEQLQQMVQEGRPWVLNHIYSFPLKPNDEEWDLSCHSVADLKEMLQLPAAMLSSMTTPDLIETCLDYQYSSDFLAFDEIQRGVEYVRQGFNGLDELLKRQNLADAMLKKYETKLQTAKVVTSRDSMMKGAFSIHFLLFKMLLAQDQVLNQLSRTQLRLLIKLSYKANELVNGQSDLFGTIHYIPSFYLYSRIIVREGGFAFASDEERLKFNHFAQTCIADQSVLAIFTEEMQQRMYTFLGNL